MPNEFAAASDVVDRQRRSPTLEDRLVKGAWGYAVAGGEVRTGQRLGGQPEAAVDDSGARDRAERAGEPVLELDPLGIDGAQQ